MNKIATVYAPIELTEEHARQLTMWAKFCQYEKLEDMLALLMEGVIDTVFDELWERFDDEDELARCINEQTHL